MKKVLFSMSLVLAATQSLAVFAVHIPGWERPILKAEMIEVDSTGHEVTPNLKKYLTMNKQDGAASPTSLTLVEEQKVYCVVAPCPPIKKTTQLTIVGKSKVSCGSTQYTALDKNAFLPGVRPMPVTQVTLVDHATRLCDDYKKYRWEATVSVNAQGKRLLLGNPEAVYTIQ